MWPDIDNNMKTDCIFDFFKQLRDELRSKFNGKLDARLENIVYQSNSFEIMRQLQHAFSNGNFLKKEILTEEEKKEEIKTYSENKYKYIIFSDKNFYRLFDLKVSEFFPIEIQPLIGMYVEDNDVFIAHNYEQFVNKIKDIIQSEYVRNLITKMLNNLEDK